MQIAAGFTAHQPLTSTKSPVARLRIGQVIQYLMPMKMDIALDLYQTSGLDYKLVTMVDSFAIGTNLPLVVLGLDMSPLKTPRNH